MNPPTFVTSVSRGQPVTFSRLLRLDCENRSLGDIPAEDAYAIHVNFHRQASFSVSMNGRVAETHFLNAGDSTILNLNEAPKVTMHSSLDTVRLYVPRSAFQDFVQDEFGYRGMYLEPPQQVICDQILYYLAVCLSELLERPEESNSLLIDYLALSLQNHLYLICSATPAGSPKARGGLAPWQQNRAKEAMEANLDKEITIAQLALDCGLSTSHFTRAFRRTTGCPPHRWLLRRRVQRAQDLLLTSDKTLAEIAISCGFSNQRHLARAFGQTVGTSPGLWRRAKRT